MIIFDSLSTFASISSVSVHTPYLTELKPTLACQQQGTHTNTLCLFSGAPYLSNSVSSNSFSLKLCFSTHIHKHTSSPRPAKGRGGWWINNGTPPKVSPAWALINTAVPAPHSSAFPAFYLPNLFHPCKQTYPHAHTYSLVLEGLPTASPVVS